MCTCVLLAHMSVHVCWYTVCTVSVKARKGSLLELGLKKEQTVL